MAVIRPFRALRPARDKAAVVSAQSYDSGSRDKATAEIASNPHSYLHIVKPYLHFPGEKKDPAKHFPVGIQYLKSFMANEWLKQDEKDSFYIYRVIRGSSAYTGIIASASVDDYLENRILRHENTLTEKQNGLAEHISWFNGLGNPVLVTYPDSPHIAKVIDHYLENHVPEYNFISEDQLKHNLWVVDHQDDIDLIRNEFASIGKLYIADGHHRSAGAATYCLQERAKGFSGDELFNFFPVCLIPFSGLQIFEYHRLINDPVITGSPGFLDNIREYFEVVPSGDLPVQPLKPHEFGLYVQGAAYLLKLKPALVSGLQPPLQTLDVSIVEEFLLRRVYGINDSKTDARLSFMEGSKGIGHLQEAVDSGRFTAAITLFRTSIEEVREIADQGLIMPPKSTWIEPKIRTGLIIYQTC
jgi:uncharacterized protein (DUF1015 family)